MGKKIAAIFSALGTAILILDTQTAITGAREGLELCIRTVIPSLFPFFIFSGILTSSLTGIRMPIFRKALRRLGIGESGSSILAVGFLGGYPIGAQAVADARVQGVLSHKSAERMIAFCNNAGPSFLFGMVASAFDRRWAGWALWAIQILSALAVGFLLPNKDIEDARRPKSTPLSLSAAMIKALKAMATVCGWVILFRVLIRVLDRWIFWALSGNARIMICGLLELSNGCCMLVNVDSTGLRLILASQFLGFGGLCVTMQTQSVVSSAGLSLHVYLPGKMLQCAISMTLTLILQWFLPVSEQFSVRENPFLVTVFVLFLAISMVFMYNQRKSTNRRWNKCCFGRKLPAPASIAGTEL